MKKKIIILIGILAIVSLTILAYYYVAIDDDSGNDNDDKAKVEVSVPKPTNYCLITYKVSTDNGNTWHEAVINSGIKPIYKAECWKKYIQILDRFSASTDKDGIWESKNQKNKILSNPSMHFSDEPFKQDSKKETNKNTKSSDTPVASK